MKVILQNDLSNVNWNEVDEILHLVGWTKRSSETTRKVFEASHLVAIATINNRIVGFGRAISDGVFNASVCDVVVHPEYQKLGIGRKIMENILVNLKEISCVQLIATTGNEDFYRKLGLKRVKTSMARYLSYTLDGEFLLD
ncbi:Acetyltransferase (GNAT) domain-containing protein [Paenibacillus sp. 1_12]|uniref:GNAT family N-acetyltransferase n=1 Tax=Paenibacillus sp. 1_12 TaxID=1566278 RepID=UPI0008EEE7A0|nr:GNAT family N-acetyltransferase [Paenibacillus sp. 1_12]SFK93463.1 Acetyltransferase (GNAT) domain-containing protein [Paenibacillus sp. 1_12]